MMRTTRRQAVLEGGERRRIERDDVSTTAERTTRVEVVEEGRVVDDVPSGLERRHHHHPLTMMSTREETWRRRRRERKRTGRRCRGTIVGVLARLACVLAIVWCVWIYAGRSLRRRRRDDAEEDERMTTMKRRKEFGANEKVPRAEDGRGPREEEKGWPSDVRFRTVFERERDGRAEGVTSTRRSSSSTVTTREGEASAYAVRFGGHRHAYHGRWGTTSVLSNAWTSQGFRVVTDESYDVLFSRYTRKQRTRSEEESVHRVREKSRVFSHCHAILGIAGNKCSFSLYLDDVRRAMRARGRVPFATALIRSYVYPHQAREVNEWFAGTAARRGETAWSGGKLIFKSCLGRKGQDIKVVDSPGHLPRFDELDPDATAWKTRVAYGQKVKAEWMVQPYVLHPLLASRRKFHMRLYVVVSSWHPLQVLLSRRGLVLIASEPYVLSASSASDDGDLVGAQRFMHLTNSAINLKSHATRTKDEDDDEDEDTEDITTMWTLDRLRRTLGEDRFDAIWEDVKRATTQLFCNWDTKRTDGDREMWKDSSPADAESFVDAVTLLQRNCFDLYGLDVVVRDDDVPIVMELNKMPSLSVESPVHREVKTALMEDIVRVVVSPLLRGRDPSEGGGTDVDASFRHLLDSFLREDAGRPSRTLSDATVRALWIAQEQRRLVRNPDRKTREWDGFDVAYPVAEDLHTYDDQCHLLGARSSLERLHLDLVRAREGTAAETRR